MNGRCGPHLPFPPPSKYSYVCYPVLDLPPRTHPCPTALSSAASRPAPRPPAPTAPAPAARPPPRARPAPAERPRPRPARPRPRPVRALGETPELVAAHVAAYRREFPAPAPAPATSPRPSPAARLRAARADRLEAELLAGLAEGDRSLGRSFHDDPDTRAALALVQRYRREAELSASRARRELEALGPRPRRRPAGGRGGGRGGRGGPRRGARGHRTERTQDREDRARAAG